MTRKTRIPAAIRRIVPDALRRSYLAKFSVLLLAVVLVTAAVGGYTYLRISTDLKEDVHHELETVSRLEAQEVGRWAGERRHMTRMLSEYDALASDAPTAIDTALWNELQSAPDDVAAMYYVNTTGGTVVASSETEAKGRTMTAVVPWKAGELSFTGDNDVRMSQPYSTGNGSSIAFASPIPNVQDRAVVMVTDATAVTAIFKSPIDGTVTKVVNADGNVVLSKQRDDVMTQYAGGAGVDSMAVKRGLDGAAGSMEMATMSGTFDEAHVMAYAPIEGTDWVLLLHTPTRTAYSIVSDATVNIGGLLLAVLLGLGLIGLTMGRTTVREIRDAAETADSIARGDLDADVAEADRIDEIGALQHSFVEMRAYLNTVAGQADALADQRFDDPVLEEDVPGEFGRTLERMRDDLEALITDIERAKENAEEAQHDAERSQREAERATERSEELNAALEREAGEFSAVMERAADGDLTGRMDPGSESDAMAEIAEAFNAMVAELESTIEHIQRFAEEVDASSEQVTSGAEEVKEASEEVSASVQQISAGSGEQSENLQEASGEMNGLSATVEQIAASADEVAMTSRRAAEAGEAGSAFAADAIEEMNEIESETARTVDEIEDLDDEIAAIGDIVGLIDDIASQTNLLALNANIEAARAGEAGDGFAVVADEIKSLAEETGEATERIERLIGGVQGSTGEAVEDIRLMSDRITDGVGTVEEALDALDAVVEHVEDADDGIRSINEATDEQAASTEEVVAMVDEVASISEESAAEAGTVSAAAEEQTAAIGEVSRSAVDLSERANDLTRLLDRFEVGSARTSTSATATDGGAETGRMEFGAPVDSDESR